MLQFINNINGDILIFIGTIGIFFAVSFMLIFIFSRINKLIKKGNENGKKTPGILGSIRNLLLIFLIAAISGMILFIGLFFRSYSVFTEEQLAARIYTNPSKDEHVFNVTLIIPGDSNVVNAKQFLIKGDQWMLEGDIIKWENWINLLGLHTRYRLTRLRGRYIDSADEIEKENTIYSLNDDERSPFWKFMYDTGYSLPFVSTVYGNAAYQNADKPKQFKIFVTTSGFLVRQVEE